MWLVSRNLKPCSQYFWLASRWDQSAYKMIWTHATMYHITRIKISSLQHAFRWTLVAMWYKQKIVTQALEYTVNYMLQPLTWCHTLLSWSPMILWAGTTHPTEPQTNYTQPSVQWRNNTALAPGIVGKKVSEGRSRSSGKYEIHHVQGGVRRGHLVCHNE